MAEVKPDPNLRRASEKLLEAGEAINTVRHERAWLEAMLDNQVDEFDVRDLNDQCADIVRSIARAWARLEEAREAMADVRKPCRHVTRAFAANGGLVCFDCGMDMVIDE